MSYTRSMQSLMEMFLDTGSMLIFYSPLRKEFGYVCLLCHLKWKVYFCVDNQSKYTPFVLAYRSKPTILVVLSAEPFVLTIQGFFIGVNALF